MRALVACAAPAFSGGNKLNVSATKLNRLFYLVLGAGIALAGSHYFAAANRPDLPRLYMQARTAPHQPPVVFIHGILGSKLRSKETGQELWFGSVTKLLFDEHEELALEIDPDTLRPRPTDLTAFAIADNTAGKDFYGNILRTLEDVGGYEHAVPGQAPRPGAKHYYTFHYDWRLDNAVSAARLADFIEQIRQDHQDPGLKVDIVAHSMGGLIARYYIRYGREDVLESNDFPVNMYGGERVRRVILLGTPSLGSVEILNAFIDGIKLGFRRINTETLATMPSLYQLLPHPLNNWIVTSRGAPLKRDIFDVEIWRRFQWSIFAAETRDRILAGYDSHEEGEAYLATLEAYFGSSLERARRFVWSLTVPLPEAHPRLIVFGGDCTLTPARILVEEVDGVSEIRMYPHQVTQPAPGVDYDALLLEPGDGSVTKASLLGRDTLDPSVPRHKYSFFPLDHAFLLCEKHNSLTGNVSFQDNLLNSLLSLD